MAQISDVAGSITLELVELPLVQPGRGACFAVSVRSRGRQTFQCTYHVASRQMPRAPVRSPARAFARSALYASLPRPFNVGESGLPEYNEPASLLLGLDWLTVILEVRSSEPPVSGARSHRAPFVSALFLLRDTGAPRRFGVFRPQCVWMNCTVDDAVKFGHDPARKLRAAQDARALAGTPGPDDYDGHILDEDELTQAQRLPAAHETTGRPAW